MERFVSFLLVTRCGCQVPYAERHEAVGMARWHTDSCPKKPCGAVVYEAVAVAGVVAGGPRADVEVLA